MGRTLVPVEQAVSAWKQAAGARNGYRRIRDLLNEIPPNEARTIVPTKETVLDVKDLSCQVGGRTKPVLDDISF